MSSQETSATNVVGEKTSKMMSTHFLLLFVSHGKLTGTMIVNHGKSPGIAYRQKIQTMAKNGHRCSSKGAKKVPL